MRRTPAVPLLVVALIVVGATPAAARTAGGAVRLAAAPTVETGAAALGTKGRVTLNGAITPASDGTAYFFEYGTSESYGQATPETPIAAGTTTKTAARAVISGLAGGTTYHYRLVGRSPEGLTPGRDRTFTTAAVAAKPPTASTQPATGVGTDRATFVARVNPNGLATTYQFEWGTTTAYGSVSAPTAAGAGPSPATVSQLITGLRPATTYQYRVVATNAAGTVRGANRTLRTSRGLTGISLVPASTTMPWNGSVELTGAVAGAAPAGAQVVILRQDFPYSGAFRGIATVGAGADGRYSYRLRRVYSSVRIKVQAGRGSAIVSPAVQIDSQLFARLRVARRQRTTARLTGRVFPARPNGRARIERLSPSGAWRTVRTVRLRRGSGGRSLFSATVPRLTRAASYRAVVDPRDGGAHVATPTAAVTVSARR